MGYKSEHLGLEKNLRLGLGVGVRKDLGLETELLTLPVILTEVGTLPLGGRLSQGLSFSVSITDSPRGDGNLSTTVAVVGLTGEFLSALKHSPGSDKTSSIRPSGAQAQANGRPHQSVLNKTLLKQLFQFAATVRP